ncbi:MAG: hypothetical protein ACPMAQ_04785 [Phycisphaerae bacterium]
MAHDYLKKSLEKQTGRASAALVMTLMGRVLVLNSFVGQRVFARPDDKAGVLNPHAAILYTSASANVIFNSARLVRFDEHRVTRPVTPSPRRRQGPPISDRPRIGVPSDVRQGRSALPREVVR